jgi:integrase
LFSLTWGDVDLSGARFTIRGETAKTGQTRTLPLNGDALAVLMAWRPAIYRSSDYVFPGTDGERLEDIKSAWLAIVKAARLRDFRLHDCRHHFASRLVQCGVDLARVSVLLGHSNLVMTSRYSHLRDEDLVAAVAAIASA